MKNNVKRKDRPFGARDKVGYTLGDFGCNMTFQLVSAQLLYFATQGLGISTLHFAIIIFIAKLFDAINDPIIGNIVDRRTPGKNGKYRPWIFWGSFAIAITTTLMFINVSSFVYVGRCIFLLVAYMLWSVAYTAVNVPYGSLNAALTDDPGQRASLSSLRNIGAGFAMLPVMLLVPKIGYVNDVIQVNRFVWIALACGLIGVVGFMATYFLTNEKTVPIVRKEKISYVSTLKGFFKNRAMVALCVASIFQLVFIMSYSITLQSVYQFYWNDTGFSGTAGILCMLPMLIYIPFMSKLSTRFGKKEITTWPNIIGIVILIIMLLIPFPRNDAGKWMFTGLLMIAMLGGGTFMLATWSMVADCVDNQEIQTGKREEASVYATYSFARKVAQGIGAGLVSLVLGWVGFIETNGQMSQEELDSALAHNSSDAVATGILRSAILMLLIGYIIVFIVLLFWYNLDKKKVIANTNYLRNLHGDENVDLEPTKLFYEEEVSKTNSQE